MMFRAMYRYALLTAALLALGSVAPHVHAQVTAAPSLINFQGRLAKPDGTPIPNGNYSIRFSLWTAASGGSEKWNQTVNPVAVRNGTFAVLLNLTSGFTAGNDLRTTLNGDTFLEIKIGTNAPLTPRQQLVSMAYALRANGVADGSITSDSIANGAITADKLASSALSNLSWLLSGNSITNPASQFLGTTSNQPLVFRTNNAEKMRLLADGKFGIGTATPQALLDVRGNLGVGTANVPVGLTHEVGGNTPLLNFEANFRHTNKNTTYRGAALRLDTRDGQPLFQFLTRAAGSSTETVPVVITESGNVGIGTASPSARLDVQGTGHTFETSDGTRTLVTWLGAAAGTDGVFLGTVSNHPLVLQANNGPVATLLPNGNFGIGTVNPTSKLHVNGTTTTQVLTITGGSDVAEPFNVRESDIQPGILVSIDPEKVGELRIASSAYDRAVAGIISGAGGVRPGLTLTQEGTKADGKHPLAMTGRVWCYADADANGPIAPGDLLTTSITPGHAMRVTEFTKATGATIGKAMSSLKQGKGLVLVLVNLQ